MHVRRLLVPVALVFALASPGAAFGASAGVSGGTLVYDGDAGTNSVTISLDGSEYTIYDSAVSAATPGPGCTSTVSAAGPLPYVTCSRAGIGAILIRTGAGDDVAQVAVGTSIPAGVALSVELGDGNDSWDGSHSGGETVSGGAGNDRIDTFEGDDVVRGGSGRDAINGGDGNDQVFGEGDADTLNGNEGDDLVDGGYGSDRAAGNTGADTVRGGPGADRVGGGLGADRIEGGGGNDVLRDDERGQDAPFRSRDVLLGGPGIDTVDYDYRLGEITPLRLSLDRRANDGAIGEGDDIGPDGSVENLKGGRMSDVIVGNGARNVLGGEEGNDIVRGLGGNDLIRGNAGHDRLDGGAGNDVVQGWWGRDVVIGGPGRDVLDGGVDADLMLASDRTVDRISCGGGIDRVVGDRFDLATRLCERIVIR